MVIARRKVRRDRRGPRLRATRDTFRLLTWASGVAGTLVATMVFMATGGLFSFAAACGATTVVATWVVFGPVFLLGAGAQDVIELLHDRSLLKARQREHGAGQLSHLSPGNEGTEGRLSEAPILGDVSIAETRGGRRSARVGGAARGRRTRTTNELEDE